MCIYIYVRWDVGEALVISPGPNHSCEAAKVNQWTQMSSELTG